VPATTNKGNLQNGAPSEEDDEEKKAQEKRALCWSVVALAMSVPALIGA